MADDDIMLEFEKKEPYYNGNEEVYQVEDGQLTGSTN